MHELFAQVLDNKDLSRAGELFSLGDQAIEAGLTAALRKIREICTAPDYVNNTNNQSVVEICITRVTSCIRETGSIEAHVGALVSVLDACLRHNLRPSARGDDPPHAKIASDVLSCLFLNYSKRSVIQRALPVAVRYLHVGNKDLSRNVSSYLSLAAIENIEILAQHAQSVIDSIISGNHLLVRIIPQIYPENKETVQKHITGIINQLPHCEAAEVASILQVAALVAKDSPELLVKQTSQLAEYLSSSATATTILSTFNDMAAANPSPLITHIPKLKYTAETQPGTLPAVTTICGAIGRMNKVQATEALNYLVSCLKVADNTTMPVLLKEIKLIAELHPELLPQHLPEITKYSQTAPIPARITIQQLKDIGTAKNTSNNTSTGSSMSKTTSQNHLPERRSTSSQTEGAVTVITIGNPPLRKNDFSTMTILSSQLPGTMSLPNYKHASTSTREIREIYRPNSVSPYGSSVTVVSTVSSALPGPPPTNGNSSRQVSNRNLVDPQLPSPIPIMERPPVTVAPVGSLHSVALGPGSSIHSVAVNSPDDRSITSSVTHGASRPLTPVSPLSALMPITPPNSVPSSYMGQPQAIPFRDAVQQFCEKHLNKIMPYVENASARVPIPIKATLEESKHKKKYCRLHFICFGQDQHCLYSQTFFSIKTKVPRIWIHLMFLAIQARSMRAVSQQEPSVGHLKVIWDSLKIDSGNSFVRLVTSSFPSTRDQDLLLVELKSNRYFDVFEFAAAQKHWACFLCNHPERVPGLLPDGNPTIEGRLQEKKGRWKIFKRWKTRYFTLSGATITYSKKDSRKETLPVAQIQSVKALRKGMRDRPKAFEIFANDQSYVFKVKDTNNAEQWVQCLQIAVARSQKHEKVSDLDIQTWDIKNKNTPKKDGQETQTKL